MAKTVSIGISTSGRPIQLTRCIDSFAANAVANGRSVRFVVADYSTDPASRNKTKAAIAKLIRRGVSIRYIGTREVDRVCGLLRSRFDTNILRFGLIGGPGAGRNLILLTTNGKIVFVDDDMVASFISPDRPAPTKTSLLRDRSVYWRSMVSDPFVVRFTNDFGIESAEMDIIGAVTDPLGAAEHDGTVKVVCPGTYGDIGINSLDYFMIKGGETSARLAFAEPRVKTAIRGVDARTITDGPFIGPGMVAVDNKRGLPPFNPVGYRNDMFGGSNVYGETLAAMDKSARFLYIPINVKREPGPVDGGINYSETISRMTASQAGSRFDKNLELLDILQRSATGFPGSGPVIDEILSRYAIADRLVADDSAGDEFMLQYDLLTKQWDHATSVVQSMISNGHGIFAEL